MKTRGFTLIETLILIALMTILLGMATIDFRAWTTKYQVERQTREMYADIMQARLTALQRKQRIGVFLGPRRYIVRAYDTEEDTVGIPILTKDLKNEIRKVAGKKSVMLDINKDVIEFDSRGLVDIGDQMTIAVMPVNIKSGGDNCLIVSVGRTNMGRMKNEKTCTAK